jgi:acetyltransferase
MAACNFSLRSQHPVVIGACPPVTELLPGQISIRFMKDDDSDLLRTFFQNLSPAARYRRFMSPMREVPAYILEHLSSIDQNCHVAYLAETIQNGRTEMIAEARYVVGTLRAHECEFAIAVADTWQGYGIGRGLLGLLEQHAVQSGRDAMTADTLPENSAMISLARRCGFSIGINQHGFRIKQLTKKIMLH